MTNWPLYLNCVRPGVSVITFYFLLSGLQSVAIFEISDISTQIVQVCCVTATVVFIMFFSAQLTCFCVVWSVLWKTAFCFSYALLNFEVLIWCQSSCLLHDFSALVDLLHFHSFFLPNQIYICDSLHVHISQFFMHCLPSTSVQCSSEWLLFHLWFDFLGLFFSILFAYYVFSRVVSVWCLHLPPQ